MPPSLGEGYIKKVIVGENIDLVLHKYNLNHTIVLRRVAAKEGGNTLIFRFIYFSALEKNHLSNVQVLTPDMSVDDNIVANSCTYYTIVSIDKEQLLSLMGYEKESEEIEAFYKNVKRSFLYQKIMSHEIKSTLRAIYDRIESAKEDKLEILYYKTKIHHLIYLFFDTLFSENKLKDFSKINPRDFERIISIENIIMTNLSTPPKLKELAKLIGVSETKMKLLFKMIFGNSIYSYFQAARISEAARILKTDKSLSISDIGYSLGFTNPSHFTKLFKTHIGVTPKKFAQLN